MDNDKYFEFLGKIKELKPVISDSKALTAKTMLHIEQMSKRKNGIKTLTYFTRASSIAASFLIGLFLFEYFGHESDTEIKNSKQKHTNYASIFERGIEKTQNRSDINLLITKKITQKNKLQSMYSNVINEHKSN
jgi:hypothetical protein